MKKCKKCEIEKPLSEFNKAGKYFQSKCKKCQYEYKKEWIKKNPKKYRLGKIRERMHITEKDFERIYKINSCQICGAEDKTLHTDHDHKTGKIRGKLCVNCNHGLGKFFDDPKLLSKAIDYLKLNQQQS